MCKLALLWIKLDLQSWYLAVTLNDDEFAHNLVMAK